VKRVLLFAATTGYQIRSFGEAASRLGVRLVFASDRCDRLDDPWWDGAIPIRFHQEQRSLGAVTRAFRSAPPDGIVAVGDRPAVVAARAAEAFGLPGHSSAGAATSRNKLATRRALKAAGLPTPAFHAIAIGNTPIVVPRSLGYPVVIKPLALSGSRGVMRADDPAALVAAIARLRRLLKSADVREERDDVHTQAIVESFVPGAEYALEGVLTRGELTTLAIFDKPDPLDGPFFEETIYLTPSRQSRQIQRSIVDHVARAARAIGLRHGPIHAECRVNPEGVYVLEVAARPIGGLCSKAVKLTAPDGSDATLEDLLLRHGIGEDVSGYRQHAGASGVMMIPIPKKGVFRGVDGVKEALAVQGVEEIRITMKPDARLVTLPEARSYLGFVFASGVEPADVDVALRAASRKLRFRIDRELPMADVAPAMPRR
jgi:biotin carboxylase